MKKIKLGKFGIGVLIYAAVLILIISVIIGILCSFLASFERNQPDRAAKEYIEKLTPEAIKGLIEKALPESCEFETADKLYASTPFAESEELKFLKKADEYTSQKPVYFISVGGKNVGKFSLTANGKDSFNMTKWRADAAELFTDDILPVPETYTVKVPAGTEITANGKSVGKKYLTEASALYSGKVYLSSAELDSAKCDIYTLPPLRSEPEISAEIGGRTVTLAHSELIFDAFGSDAVSTVITAPSDSAVMLDGLRIPAEFFTATDERVALSEFEVSEDIKLPTLMHCRVLKRATAENITATVSGKAMSLTEHEGGFLAEYTESSLLSVEITVPEGCEIKLNGIALSEKYFAGDGIFQMLEGMERFTGKAPTAKVYRITGLFREPEISVTSKGVPLSVCHKSEKAGVTYAQYYGAPSDPLKASAEQRVLDFAAAYITYTCEGYVNVDAHHAALMSYLISGTETYKKLQRSKDSFSWAENYTVTDRSLVCGDLIPVTENSFFCTVDYTASLKKYSYKTEQKGILRLLMVKSGGVWLVGGLLIENK